MSECTAFTPTSAGLLQAAGCRLPVAPAGSVTGSDMGRFEGICSLIEYPPLDVTAMPGEKAMTSILPLPQVSCQSNHHQSNHREENLLHHRAGNDSLRIPVDNRDLTGYPAEHDKAHRRREEHCPLALDELRGCGEQHPASDDNQEYQARDGVIAEGRALQPGNGEPPVKR